MGGGIAPAPPKALHVGDNRPRWGANAMAAKASILIPTYNYAQYLPEAIESVLAQDFTDYELIVSDDASTDNSAEIIRRYAIRDSRIRATFHPVNLGMVANWNWCLGQARGAYIKFLFGDDRLATPHALRRFTAMLDAHPQAALTVCARRVVDAHSQPLEVWDQFAEEGLYAGRHVGRQCLLATHNFVGEPTAVMFRAALAPSGFDLRYRQIVDLELWCRLLLAGDLVYTRETLCDFRWHPSQQTRLNQQQNLGNSEYTRLLHDYFSWFVPADYRPPSSLHPLLFRSLYDFQRTASSSVEAREIARTLMTLLGRGPYVREWLRHRLVRPLANLRRVWCKHVLRREVTSRRPSSDWRLKRS